MRRGRLDFILAFSGPLGPDEIDGIRELEDGIYDELVPLIEAAVAQAAPDGAFEAALRTTSGYIGILNRRPKRPPACKAGCGWCCRSHRILVEEMEVVAILRVIEAAANRGFLHARIAGARPTGSAGTACAMLSPGDKCMVHAVRPITCMAYLSGSRSACRSHAEGRGGVPGATFVYPYLAVNALYDHAVAPMREARGFAGNAYELNSILKRVVGDEGKLRAWLDGKPTVEDDLVVANVRD